MIAVALFAMQVETLILRAALRNMNSRSRYRLALDAAGREIEPTSPNAVAWSVMGAIAKEASAHGVPDPVRDAALTIMRSQIGSANGAEQLAQYSQLVIWWTAGAAEARLAKPA